ncbi:MAG: serine/threonine-protein kinase RsbW [Acidobacteriota bacterium]|jgi:serine/threonine-protein kinase RsbW|nr:serine/threonine-protein kinase RsbW [Acidobacteriota bacterium]
MPVRSPKQRRILARTTPEAFVGRGEELQEINALSSPKSGQQSLLLFAAPQSGVSELLRQSFDEMFRQRGGAAPVYFAFSRSDAATTAAARRFLHTFLTQTVAHRSDDPALVSASPTLRSLLDLAAPQDYEWIERLIQSFERAQDEGDERALVRLCLGAPQQAAAGGVRTVVMFDDMHHAERLRGEDLLGPALAHAAIQSSVPFVIAGPRRRLLDLLNGVVQTVGLDGLRKLHFDRLKASHARTLLEGVAQRHGVTLSDETRDLIVQQFESSPYLINALLDAARAGGTHLSSFREFQTLYVDELLGGRIHRRFNHVLEEVAPSLTLRRNLLRVLYESASSSAGKSPAEAWMKRLGVDAAEFERVMRLLHLHELASFHATYVETTPTTVWRDFLRVSYRLQVAAEPRALVVADLLVETLKRAPKTMARHYRRESALKLVDVMRRFNFEHVPASLLHYDRFVRMYRGIPREEVQAGLEVETDLARLPQIVHAASCASFHPPILQFCDEERCSIAHGFESGEYAEGGEVVWMAAEVESKLEAGRALTGLWLDRLEQVAQSCGFERVRLWLLAREGFSAEAAELLNERGAYGSCSEQLDLLTARLGGASLVGEGDATADEFAIELPMSEDTELIAAHTVEQIARRMEFQPEAINQIKTALVEACINAAEHSLSTERKIYNRFRVEDDKLVITVSSRGLSLPTSNSENGTSSADKNGGEGAKGRRGWGLKLIRTLMDDVEFERVDDGTRLRMTKYLRK